MKYIEYRKKLKEFNLSSGGFAKIIGLVETTPSAVWKRKGAIPIFAERFLEVLDKLPENERVVYIHHKLKEAEQQ